MEKTSTWVDIYLGKLFAGEAVKIEDVFRKEEELAPDLLFNLWVDEERQERFLHS